MGYPVEAAEIAMLDSHTRSNPLDDLEPVADAAEIRKLIDIVGQVYVSEAVQRYAVAITTATRKAPEIMQRDGSWRIRLGERWVRSRSARGGGASAPRTAPSSSRARRTTGCRAASACGTTGHRR